MEDDYSNNTLTHYNSDFDYSFTSSTSIATTTSARSSSSLCLSFNDSTRISSVSTIITTSSTEIPNHHHRPHRTHDPNWSAIRAATTLSPDHTLHLHHLKLIRHVGSGNLGRVFQCRVRDNDHASFALKVIDHNYLTCKKLSHVQTEGQILSILDHPFVPTLYAHIQASHYTCFLIDFCTNGDLHSLLRKQPNYRFPINAVRFYVSEVLTALEYLHSNGIIYRDVKPENILIRDNGHIMLSDFDLCFNADVSPKLDNPVDDVSHRNCLFSGGRREEKLPEFVAEPTTAFSKSCVGTHEYLAPELVSGDGHGNGVDWWAFGILIYELIYGTTPFRGGSKEETLNNIVTKTVRFEEGNNNINNNNRGMTQVKDLIEKLLVKDPGERLGCARGATDIKRHPFFDGIKWPLIRMYRPPEVKGVTVKKGGMAHVSHVVLLKKRRSLWKGFGCIVEKDKGFKC